MLTLWANGTKILLGNDVAAIIHGVTIYSEEWVKYRCVWWVDGVRHEEWLHEDEFTNVVDRNQRVFNVGFSNGKRED